MAKVEFDIVIVTFNSLRWVDGCIKSIEKQKNFDLKNINLYFVDNCSTDKTISRLEWWKKRNKFGSFTIVKNKDNLGFGKANNIGFSHGSSKYVFFLNHDTELSESALFQMEQNILSSSKNYAVWEFRQQPYEHPKIYNPITGETSWCSGACVIVLRKVFEKVGGFDEKIFMYAEDVDLSWHIRLEGYKLRYVSSATLTHYCYESAGETKPIQFYNSIINNLNLRLKYGSLKDVLRWIKYFLNILRSQLDKKLSKWTLILYFVKNIPLLPHFIFWRFRDGRLKKIKVFEPHFILFDYETTRLGAFVPNDEKLSKHPLVSVLIRTCNRPAVLREALISVRNQTYKNIEVVVVEDGKNSSEKMIKKEFGDLNIIYKATEKKVGRCKAGNIALELASGMYLNFLDDDDAFFNDHIETLLRVFQDNKSCNLVYSAAFEAKVDTVSEHPRYEYYIKGFNNLFNCPFKQRRLLTSNLFPIQAVMFKKTIFKKYGGFDIELDNLEDWEFWARISFKESFIPIGKTTSVFKTPANPDEYIERGKNLENYYLIAKRKIKNRALSIS